MNDSRSQILARLRRVPPATGQTAPEIPVSRFDWDAQERLSRFRERLEAVRGEVRLVGADWPASLKVLLAERGAGNLLYGPGSAAGDELLAGWPGGEGPRLVPYAEPIEAFRAELFDGIDAGLTGCRGAVAETGTLVLWPDSHEPRLLSLVPPVHIVLLDVAAIRSTFAELMDEQNWGKGMPTNALLISGPSKSADIEQTLAYGVHGPKALIVLVRE